VDGLGFSPIRGPVGVIPLARMLRANLVAGLFLDRDGVINVKAPAGQYITSPDDLVLLCGAAVAIRYVNKLGIPVYIVTNQRWVASRNDGIERIQAIHNRLGTLLGLEGAYVDGIYTCVHEINRCQCRKPQRGLVDQALRYNPKLALPSSVMVGDAETDIELASRCGMYSVRLFGDEEDIQHSAPQSTQAQETAPDLHSAVVGECIADGYQPTGAQVSLSRPTGNLGPIADHRRKVRMVDVRPQAPFRISFASPEATSTNIQKGLGA
jgi:D-glycero-D-manno-heptose 1,7-bisphosphate phosphatase